MLKTKKKEVTAPDVLGHSTQAETEQRDQVAAPVAQSGSGAPCGAPYRYRRAGLLAYPLGGAQEGPTTYGNR
jgi:hypothetical protein